MVGCIRLSPHSRLRRQCGVIHNVTARAVNIAGYQHFAMKSLAELADAAEVGDWLTQIHWIYKIFLRKSAISARDYLYKEQSLPTHNRASGCNFYNLALTTSVAKSATWGKSMNPKDINRGAVADSAIKVI